MTGSRLTTAEISRIREMRYGGGLSCRSTAEAAGVNECTVRRYAPGYVGKVPNDRVRAMFEQSPMTAADVARKMGWYSGKRPEASRVRRTLGLLADSSGSWHQCRRLIDAGTAGLLAEAMGHAAREALPGGSA